jgi:guanine deaminase
VQLWVVWYHRLIGDTEGPALITDTACTATYCRFPSWHTDNYTGVYHKYGLLRERAIYGHGIHLSDEELDLFSATGAAIAHCPTSNFFLGSGYFDLKNARTRKNPVHVGIATDLGAGTSFSILQTLNEAYKAAQLNSNALSSGHAFYQASRGTASALGLADKIGTIAPGFEADLAVIDLHSTPIIDYRMRYCESLEESLFIQMTLADDRAIAATYVAGRQVYDRT